MDLDDYDVLNTVLDDDVARFVRAMVPETDDVYEELAAKNVAGGVPVVGPEVGATLRVLARLVAPQRAFEFGSGRGYSAYWIAPVIPADGELVLTDFDEANVEAARTYFERGGYADRTRFEVGDALEYTNAPTVRGSSSSSTTSRNSIPTPGNRSKTTFHRAASSVLTTSWVARRSRRTSH